jgi:hypothetical protein
VGPAYGTTIRLGQDCVDLDRRPCSIQTLDYGVSPAHPFGPLIVEKPLQVGIVERQEVTQQMQLAPTHPDAELTSGHYSDAASITGSHRSRDTVDGIVIGERYGGQVRRRRPAYYISWRVFAV